MRCALSFLSVVILVIAVGAAAFYIIWTTNEDDYPSKTTSNLTNSKLGKTNFTFICPKGYFMCEEDESCIANPKRCNGLRDCPKGSDEDPMNCNDMGGAVNSIIEQLKCGSDRRKKVSNFTNTIFNPLRHGCTRDNHAIMCMDIALNPIPWEELDLEASTLLLLNILNLTVLREELVPPKNNSISRLTIEYNILTTLEESSICNWNRTCWIHLSNNNIQDIAPNAFCEMPLLEMMYLTNNSFTLEGFRFKGMPQLRNLYLNNNHIVNITNDMFASLTKLKTLHLISNRISFIDKNAFKNNADLRDIDLTNNRLKQFPPECFSNQKFLFRLYIGNNPFEILPGKIFSHLEYLESLNLEGIDIEVLDVEALKKLKSLDWVTFKKFTYCRYLPNVSRCYPFTDGMSSFMDLLAGTSIRCIVWIVAGLTLVGNLIVLISRGCFSKKEKRLGTMDVFVKNLAGADFLMGVYLTVLAIKDIEYRNFYNNHAYDWSTSFLCSGIGVLAMISSEVSLLILTIMSAERYLVISGPFTSADKKLSLNLARLSMIIIWIFVTGLALAPAVQWRGKQSYYGSTGLCFPVHLDDPYSVGWQYTTFVIVGLNSICLIIVALSYTTLFYAVRKTRLSTTIKVNKDMEMALRFFLMIFTDCLCWLPIIMLKIYALTGHWIPKKFITWVVVFVLPINSSINPFLYTLSMSETRMTLLRRLNGTSLIRVSRNIINLPLRRNRPRLEHIVENSHGNSWNTSNTMNTSAGDVQKNNSRKKTRLSYQESFASSNVSVSIH